MRKEGGNKKLIIISSVLVGLVAVLLVAVLVVHNIFNSDRNDEVNMEELEKTVSSATEDCVGLKEMYGSGIMSKEEAQENYERKMREAGEDNAYKVYLTFCYANYIRYNGATSEESMATLTAVEPYLSTDYERIDYYDLLIKYYTEEDDWDNARHYAKLRDELMPMFDDEEGDNEGDGEGEEE